VDGRAHPNRNWGVNWDRQQKHSKRRRGRWQDNKFRRRRRQEKHWRRRRRRERIDWIVEHQNRPLNIDDLLRRRRWHVVSHLGERGWRLESGGEKSKAATRIGRVWTVWIAPQVRPIGVRRIDRSGAAPGDRLPSRGDDCSDPLDHWIVGISHEEVVITLQRVTLQSRGIRVLCIEFAYRSRAHRLHLFGRNCGRRSIGRSLKKHERCLNPRRVPGNFRALCHVVNAQTNAVEHLG
jgi:hypothetical protein